MTRRFAQAPPFRAGVNLLFVFGILFLEQGFSCCKKLVRAEPSGANVVRFRARA